MSIGQVLVAKDHDALQICGVDGKEFVVQNLTSLAAEIRHPTRLGKIYR